MTNEQLERANEIKKEINELEFFIHRAEKTWTGRIFRRAAYFVLKSNAYGAIDSAEFFLKTPIKNKVLDVLRGHLKELKKELEEM